MMQRQFLSSPVCGLANVYFVRVAPIDLVQGTELLQLFAGDSKLAENFPFPFHFANLTVFHARGFIRV
jgi:hypothetical protein